MSVLPLVKQFDALTRRQILALQPGAWGDDDLLDVLQYFDKENKDEGRALAVAELILGSHQVADVDYSNLYLDVIGYYRWKSDFPSALRWTYTLITYDEQHENGLNRANRVHRPYHPMTSVLVRKQGDPLISDRRPLLHENGASEKVVR